MRWSVQLLSMLQPWRLLLRRLESCGRGWARLRQRLLL